MTLTRIQPFGPDAYTYWIDGIYKVVSYNKGAYHAYFIPHWANNWGDNVSTPPDLCPVKGGGTTRGWDSLRIA